MSANDQRSPHILNASSNLLGLCFIVLTSIKLLNLKAATIVDEIATFAIAMFMTSSLLSFLSIRRNNQSTERLEKVADIFFLAGLFLLFISALFISFDIVK